MAFIKRHISKESIIKTYETGGIEALQRLLDADALISESGIDSDLLISYLTEGDNQNIQMIVESLKG